MDLNDVRIAFTLASLALFVALVLHTWSQRRGCEHEAAAALPFVSEDNAEGSGGASRQGEPRE